MGVEPLLVYSSTECSIAQRLVRIICKHCKEAYHTTKDLLKEIGIHKDPKKVTFYRGKGCPECQMTGYKGRTAIYEILMVTKPIRELIVAHAPSNVINKKSVVFWMKPLRQHGIDKSLNFITSIEEILRVSQQEE